jgi:hypothetical protein
MFVDKLSVLSDFFLSLLTLSDSAFYHLLGLLAVITFLRFFVPLHCTMARELFRRNEIADLAEEERCTEYDIFVKAHNFFYGSEHSERIKHDFIAYLKNWPDNSSPDIFKTETRFSFLSYAAYQKHSANYPQQHYICRKDKTAFCISLILTYYINVFFLLKKIRDCIIPYKCVLTSLLRLTANLT